MKKQHGIRRWYHRIEMKPHSIGRVLGIGVRIAGRIAGERINAAANQPAVATAQTRSAGEVAGKATGGVARGVGGFLRPFRRIGGILWLEVTGIFFLLFAVVFSLTLWRLRLSYAQGADHQKFLVTAVLVGLFLYLSVSSFWRARRR